MILTGSSRPESMPTGHGNRTGRRANNQASCVVAEKTRANNVPLRATTLPTLPPLSSTNAQDLQHRHRLSKDRNPLRHCQPRPVDYRRTKRRCLQHYWLARTSCHQRPRHRLLTLCSMSKTNNQDVHLSTNQNCVLNNRQRKSVRADLVSPLSWSAVEKSQMTHHSKTLRTGVFSSQEDSQHRNRMSNHKQDNRGRTATMQEARDSHLCQLQTLMQDSKNTGKGDQRSVASTSSL